jgi:hypothetical protein
MAVSDLAVLGKRDAAHSLRSVLKLNVEGHMLIHDTSEPEQGEMEGSPT